jgi:UDP-N-acetylmuramate: L-alanyl-gamma-D-glutamyl-meso-diaminopimelate ligase
LQSLSIDCDYLVGAQLAGFDTMVKLTKEAKIAVIEGDEYLSSPIDRRPKFHLYKPNIALLSGIAWDHINVFPTFEIYVNQFKLFIDLIEPNGSLVYCKEDTEVKKVCETARKDIALVAYSIPKHKIENGITTLIDDDNKEYPLAIFGEHNLMNLTGAQLLCERVGVTKQQFYKAIQSFTGAAKRLELIAKNNSTVIYKDFAHSPSKLKATTKAVKEQFPDRALIACMELHTFSSLNEAFLKQYEGAMAAADEAIVYFNPHTIAHKKLQAITEEQVKNCFGGDNIKVFTDAQELENYLLSINFHNKNLLMMSSGTFDGMNLLQLGESLLS